MRSVPGEVVLLQRGPLVLRAFDDSDARELREAFADQQIRLWNPGPVGGATLERAGCVDPVIDWLRRRSDWSAGAHASWAISNSAGAMLGSVSLFGIEPEHAHCEVGYWVAPEARGRGLAGQAVRLASDFAFAELDLERVFLGHAVENVASCRVAEAAGFRLEGAPRRSWRYGDGWLHDEHLHGRLATD